MLSSFAINALVAVAGLTAVVSATKPIATVKPCPSCPKSLKMAPITVTAQYQAVSTCVPEKTSSSKLHNSTYTTSHYETASCSTYDYVSTHIPCLGGTTTTLITSTDQTVQLAHVSTVLTSYIPCPTAPVYPTYSNGTGMNGYKNETVQCTPKPEYTTMVVDIAAPYNECGPIALYPWEGSGLCGKVCQPNEDETDQPVHVTKCLNGACSTYAETWVSLKPTTTYSSEQVSYTGAASCTKSGSNTIPVTDTYTPTNYPSEGGYSAAPVTSTWSLTTSVSAPGPVYYTKTITVTYTAKPAPTVAHSTSTGVVSTTTVCSSGVHTIPIVTTCTPHGPGYTSPITTTVYVTTTITGAPVTVTCTKTITVTYTSTSTICPVTVVSGSTHYPSSTAPPSVSATTTGGSQGTSTGGPHGSSTPCPSSTLITSTVASTGTATSTGGGTGSSTTSGTPTPSHPSHGIWDYYGCLGSTDGFPSFSLQESSGAMDVDLCTSECLASGATFAGLYRSDCYCANSIDAGTSAEAANGVCNIPCPGDAKETCGGDAINKRRALSNKILLDVYECEKPTPTSTSSSSSTSQTSDPSSDPDPEPQPRGIDADMVAAPQPRDMNVRRGGLLRNPKVQKAPALAKRNFGLKQPFGH